LVLLGELEPDADLDDIFEETDVYRKAEMVIFLASEMGSVVMVNPRDLVDANPALLLFFLAGLFSTRTGLADPEDIEEELLDQVGIDQHILDAMSEEVKEERSLCVWVNTLLNLNVPNLFRALKVRPCFAPSPPNWPLYQIVTPP